MVEIFNHCQSGTSENWVFFIRIRTLLPKGSLCVSTPVSIWNTHWRMGRVVSNVAEHWLRDCVRYLIVEKFYCFCSDVIGDVPLTFLKYCIPLHWWIEVITPMTFRETVEGINRRSFFQRPYPSGKNFGLSKAVLSVQRPWKIDSAPEHQQ